jgi:hypothetical protein
MEVALRSAAGCNTIAYTMTEGRVEVQEQAKRAPQALLGALKVTRRNIAQRSRMAISTASTGVRLRTAALTCCTALPSLPGVCLRSLPGYRHLSSSCAATSIASTPFPC